MDGRRLTSPSESGCRANSYALIDSVIILRHIHARPDTRLHHMPHLRNPLKIFIPCWQRLRAAENREKPLNSNTSKPKTSLAYIL